MAPEFIVLEEVDGDVLADRDVDELFGGVDQVQDGAQIVRSTRGQCYKTFYGRKLRIFVIS